MVKVAKECIVSKDINSLAIELHSHGLLTHKQLNSVINFEEEHMLCKVKFKDCNGDCYLQGDYTLAKEYLEFRTENDLVKALNQMILPKLSIDNFKLPERGKGSWVDVECWEYAPSGEYRGYDNKMLRTIRLKVNPFKLNLGTLELIVDKE